MFILRSVALKDLDDLYQLSKLYVFINLPSDRGLIEAKIKSSLKAFNQPSRELSDNHYIFILEDLSLRKVIGCSMIHAQHGTEEEPHFFLTVDRENKFSSSINTGFIHGTLKLGYETNGSSEIGGLILDPDYRANKSKLGKQLSFIRFMYMGLNPKRFTKNIHCELMPPFDTDGKSPLWEAVGRRFLNMEYHDADLLSRNNKEFILSLFPSSTIYETLLPLDARDAIGKVGKDTIPVKKMLEKIGFEYTHEVDPFDGGPHYRCELNKIKPVKNMLNVEIDIKSKFNKEEASVYLISLPATDNDFRAAKVNAIINNDKIVIDPSELKQLGISKAFKTNVFTI